MEALGAEVGIEAASGGRLYNLRVLTYRAGDPDRPRGHALLFFRDGDDPDVVLATYLVVAPIAMDLTKYIPAAFASSLPGQLAAQANTAYPLPPVPERVEGGLEWIDRMAAIRGDDVLDGGTLRSNEPWQLMQPITEVGQQYAEQFSRYVESAVSLPEPEPALEGQASVDVDSLLLQVMPDAEKVSRLARLTGTLRYAVEGGDQRQVRETVTEMERVARHLPEKYRVAELIAVAQSTETSAGQLAQLYVERCYRLADEDYGALTELERRIGELKTKD